MVRDESPASDNTPLVTDDGSTCAACRLGVAATNVDAIPETDFGSVMQYVCVLTASTEAFLV